MNDPNGIHYAEGLWHVFFQYNPESARHRDIHWGQMSSPDLLRWGQEGTALTPQRGAADEHGCWSGVAVIDEGVPTLVYSGVRDLSGHSDVMLARPSPDGRGWVQSDHIAAPMPADRAVLAVRDPFIFDFDGRRWGLVGASHAPGIGAILLYDASDLTNWKERGLLLDSMQPVCQTMRPANLWECPQLVQVGDDWVLIVSLWIAGHPTEVAYVVGSLALDRATGLPQFTPRATGTLDDGPSYYAPQAVPTAGADGVPDRVLVWAWAREVVAGGQRGRTEDDADAVGWSGTLTFPRELVVDGDRVSTVPARELTALRGAPLAQAVPDQAELLLRGSGPVELWLAADGEPGQRILRSELSGNELRILIDASLVEAFPQGGMSRTLRAYPADGDSYRLVVGPDVTVAGWELRLPA